MKYSHTDKHGFFLLLPELIFSPFAQREYFSNTLSLVYPIIPGNRELWEQAINSMRTKTLQIVAVLLCCMLLGIGCEPELDTSPILPGEKAVLVITFSPSPVHEGYESKYRFTAFIDEVNGVGARITSIKIEYIDDLGNVFETDNYGESRVAQDFFGTSRIEAYGRLMTSVEGLECSGCARTSWLVRADDDRGNHIEYSGTVELIPR